MFKSALLWLLTNIAATLVGILIGVLFQKRVEAAWARLARRLKLLLGRRGTEHLAPESFALGRRSLAFLVVDGDGQLTYTPETLRVRLETPPAALPVEIEERKNQIAAREEAKRARGELAQWNGPMYALRRYAIGRTIPREDLELTLTFVKSDYFTFQATVMSLDVNFLREPARLTLRQKYLLGNDLLEPIEHLAQAFGVSLAVLSTDQKMIFGWRNERTGARPGELDVAVVEAVHPENDRATDGSGPDLYRCAVRGAQEELGLQVTPSQVTYLGFGVDTDYYQWNMLGVIRLPVKAKDALDSRRRGSGGKWESRRLDVVSADPREVFKYLSDKRMWPMGWVTTYWALVNDFGRAAVDSAAKSILH